MANRSREKTRHLGRGLESLLSPLATPEHPEPQPPTQDQEDPAPLSSQTATQPDTNVRQVPLSLISPNPYQARTHWNDAKLKELAESIAANGVVQPIVLRRTSIGYQIIAGERRFRASELIGAKTVPAIIREATDEQMHEWALVENIHRDNLNAIERARAYRAYIESFDLTQTEAAKRLGEDRSVISNHLRLLELPQDLQQLLINDQLTMGHLRALLTLPSPDLQRKLAHRALAGRLSVRDVERLAKTYFEQSNPETPTPPRKPAHIEELEDIIKMELGTRVKISTNKSGKSGKIVIEFRNLSDFDRVLEKLGIDPSSPI